MKNYTASIKRRFGILMQREVSVQFADTKLNGSTYELKIGFHVNDGKDYACNTSVTEEQLINAPDTAKFIDNVIGDMANDVRTAWNKQKEKG